MRTYSKRVQELITDMSIEEKISQLSCTIPLLITKGGKVQQQLMEKILPAGIGRFTQFAGGFFEGPKAAALAYNQIQTYVMEHSPHHIPALMQNEGLTGLVAAKATAFPIPMLVASTWDAGYARNMGEVIGEEAKAIGVKLVLSPVADVARDARWGRTGETYGEDPLIVSSFSTAEVAGLQQGDIKANVASCAKHFMGYAASEGGINTARVAIGEKELLEVHGTPFAAMIKEEGLESVMVTYSELDGLPMSVNAHYTKDILRDTYGFEGVAVCDALSIPSCHLTNGIGKDMTEVVKWALEAGIDADTPITQAYGLIQQGIASGRIDQQLLDDAVARVLDEKERLGLFDQPLVDPEAAEALFNKSKSKALSKQIAQKGFVLLKNENCLPLSKPGRIAMIGPFVDKVSTLFGGYAYTKFIEMFADCTIGKHATMKGLSSFFDQFVDKPYTREVLHLKDDLTYDENIERYIKQEYQMKTLFDAMREEFQHSTITYTKGIDREHHEEEIQHAVLAAKDSDVVVITLGEVTGFGEDSTSGEGVNNPSLRLPAYQEELIKAVHQTGKPILLLLFNSRPIILKDIEACCDAILEVWYPGPYGAEAIAEVVSGKATPGGKLPISFPTSSSQCPLYYGGHAGGSYCKVDGTQDTSIMQPFYPFGYGLSYTSFTMQELKAPSHVRLGEPFTVSVQVHNTGCVEGDEIVQLYSQTLQASITRPVKELRAFCRVSLLPKESKTVQFTLDTKQFAYYDRHQQYVVEPSDIKLMAGHSSANIVEECIVHFGDETYLVTPEERSFQPVSIQIL